MTDLQIASKYMSLHNSAKSRGIHFSLTLGAVRKMMSAKRCFYTNKEFSATDVRSIDRVDNSLGYTDKNCVACIEKFNMRKADLTVEEITQMYNGIKRNKKA